MTPTQADREAAAEMCDYAFGPLSKYAAELRQGLHDSDPSLLAFARHRLAAEAAAFEKATGVVKEHQAARLAAKHNALERGQKAEARDHESMAMEAGFILASLQTFIRKFAGEKHD